MSRRRRSAQAPLDAAPQHAADVQGLRKGTGFSSLQQHVGEPADRSFRSRTRTFFTGDGVEFILVGDKSSIFEGVLEDEEKEVEGLRGGVSSLNGFSISLLL